MAWHSLIFCLFSRETNIPLKTQKVQGLFTVSAPRNRNRKTLKLFFLFNQWLSIRSFGRRAQGKGKQPFGTICFDWNRKILTLWLLFACFKNSSAVWFDAWFFHDFIVPGEGQTTHLGQNFDVNRKASSLQPLILYTSFHDLINVYSPGQGQTTHRGTNNVSIETSCYFNHWLQV